MENHLEKFEPVLVRFGLTVAVGAVKSATSSVLQSALEIDIEEPLLSCEELGV
jgi:hypothetical protein